MYYGRIKGRLSYIKKYTMPYTQQSYLPAANMLTHSKHAYTQQTCLHTAIILTRRKHAYAPQTLELRNLRIF